MSDAFRMAPRFERLPSPELDEVEETAIEADESINISDSRESSRSDRLREELRSYLLDIADALQTPRSECPEEIDNMDALSLLSLQKDLRRCYSLLHPMLEVAAAFYDMLMWKDAFSTLLFSLVFFYSIYRQWTAILVLLLLILQFSLNFLASHKGIEIGLYFLPRKNLSKPSFNINGAQLIIEVAKYVQYLLRFTVNVLEKVHSLFTWQEKHVTLRFCYLLVYWLAWAVLFDLGTCLSWCVAAFGVRIFFTTYLFERFPRLRKSLDTYGYFYRNLPTKKQRLPSYSEDEMSSPRGLSSSSQSISNLRSVKSKSRFRLWTQSKQFLRRPAKTG